jgi:isoleucyl-tRNA synthetase
MRTRNATHFPRAGSKSRLTQFKRIGVLADWANEYKTKAPAFEADILRTFASFVEQGLVYRSKKPVYWSIPFETALAEAEIEYKEHTFDRHLGESSPCPRLRPRNSACPPTNPSSSSSGRPPHGPSRPISRSPVHPEVDYVVADLGAERIIVAQALLSPVLAAAKIETQPAITLTLKGAPAGEAGGRAIPSSTAPPRRAGRLRHDRQWHRLPSTPRPATARTTISPASNTSSRDLLPRR